MGMVLDKSISHQAILNNMAAINMDRKPPQLCVTEAAYRGIWPDSVVISGTLVGWVVKYRCTASWTDNCRVSYANTLTHTHVHRCIQLGKLASCNFITQDEVSIFADNRSQHPRRSTPLMPVHTLFWFDYRNGRWMRTHRSEVWSDCLL